MQGADWIGDGAAVRLRLTGLAADGLRQVWFFPEDYGVLEHAAPQPLSREGGMPVLTLVRGEVGPEPAGPLRGVLVATRDGPAGTVAESWTVEAMPTAAASATSGLILALMGAGLYWLPGPVRANAQVGQTAPMFAGTDSQGKVHRLAAYRGKTVVLEWTNHDCAYVRKHYGSGNMQQLQRQAAADGAIWLTVISSAPASRATPPAARPTNSHAAAALRRTP